MRGKPETILRDTVERELRPQTFDLVQDVLMSGITLTGGGGLLRGLDMLISQEAEVPVHITEQPLEAVVLGAGKCLESFDAARSIFVEARR